MTIVFGIAALIVTVVVFGMFGVHLTQRAAPLLMRMPRVAVLMLMSTLGIWLLAALAIGPVLAWVLTGPNQFMPGTSAQVCQRCLQAANPLQAGATFETVVPVIVLLLAPVVLVGILVVTGLWYRHRRQHRLRLLGKSLPCGTDKTMVAGYHVVVVPSAAPIAFALPRRRCGIVISPGLLALLNEQELRAVLAHEAAHLRQRHHLILAVLNSIIVPLRWVPLVAAISKAVPQYLEMAADNAARAEVGTPALASALLKIGEKPATTPHIPDVATGFEHDSLALHAAGPDRIRQLVAPTRGLLGAVPLLSMLSVVGVLMVTSLSIHTPYFQAVLAGCLT